MNIAVVGTGYVGLVTAACMAELGHTVFGVDIDAAKVEMMKQGKSPIFEPGLEEVMQRGLKAGRLSFTTDLASVLPQVNIVFSAVATPPNADHTADLRAVYAVSESVARHAEASLVFVNKSTVPVGTGEECEKRMAAILAERGKSFFIPVVSNPEFLREGMAVGDTLMPDRIVVGLNERADGSGQRAEGLQAQELMEELYRPLTRTGKPLLIMARESAEIVKYASNAFLAAKISFINMLTPLCEKTGGSIRDVARGMGLDDRIGPRFLHAGIGYGGSCFPKDVKALLAIGKQYGVPMDIVSATDAINVWQRERFIEQLVRLIPERSRVAVWGLAFKPKTDDMREAPSIDVIRALVAAGHTVTAFDPVAAAKAKPLLPPETTLVDSPMVAAEQAQAVVLLTEWDEFRGVDFSKLKSVMAGTLLFDARNVYEPDEVRAAGFTYVGLGVK